MALRVVRTPQSISVVTRDQIDLLNFVDAQQAVRYVSSVTGENYGPDLRYDFISVRGFTPRQFIDGLAAPVSTTIQSVGVDLYAFESFEVLKGPASVLYGAAPPGGIYNQISRRASDDFGGEVQAKYGMYDYKTLSGTITGRSRTGCPHASRRWRSIAGRAAQGGRQPLPDLAHGHLEGRRRDIGDAARLLSI